MLARMTNASTGRAALAPMLAVLGAAALALGPLAPRALPHAGAGLCHVPEPVVSLSTPSKIDVGDPAKASDGTSAGDRAAMLRPVRAAVRSIAEAAEGDGDTRACAAHALAGWARAGALTDMRGKDANLTRGRLAGELLVAAVRLDERDAFSPRDRAAVGRWANRLARQTVLFFEHGAGEASRGNNHRQWAALAVGAAGRLTGDPMQLAWARESANVALCAVTADGFLPAELARGRRAWRYHRYALRPLRALDALGAWDGAPAPCADGLERLARVAARSDLVAVSTGIAQDGAADERTFSPALRLADQPPEAL